MAPQKQIQANRENAKRSSGPRSSSGKARSRLNAVRDGLTGQITTLSEKDRPFFEQHRAKLIAGFDPQTPMEQELAQSIAWDTWRLHRLRAIETNVYALGIEEEDEDPENPDDFDDALSDARTFRAESKRFDLMSLYEQRMNRNIHRNLTTLRELIAERRRNYERDKQEEIRIARLHEYNSMPIQASVRPSKNGFLFSNEEIATGAVRQRYADAASNFLKTGKPSYLYGTLMVGCGESILRKQADDRPLSAEEEKEINSVPPEIRAIHRLNHPEEYGLQK